MTGDLTTRNIEAMCALAASFSVTGINAIATQAAFIMVNIVIAIFGTLANGLVIIVYYRNRRLRNHQATIFLLLAITDFSITAFVQPMFVVMVWKRLFGNHDCGLALLVYPPSMMLLDLSLMTIVILSLHTYITLAFPYRLHNMITTSRLTKGIFFSWLLPVVKNLCIFLNFELVLEASFWLVCCEIVVVIFTWSWTYKLVARHRKAIQTTQAPSNRQNVSQKKILRSTITAFAIVASLIACYSSYLSFTVFERFPSHSNLSRKTRKILWTISVTLMYFSSLLNPCLVFWRNSGFREAVKKVLN